MNEPRKQISPERQGTYYLGMLLSAIGVVLFFIVFISMFAGGSSSGSVPPLALAPVGIVLIAIGRGLMSLGAKGLAGSGVVLDPEQARKDVEPWTRMAGGMVDDGLSEMDTVKKLVEERLDAPKQVVKVRCRQCQALNDEDAKFCNQCGGEM